MVEGGKNSRDSQALPTVLLIPGARAPKPSVSLPTYRAALPSGRARTGAV